MLVNKLELPHYMLDHANLLPLDSLLELCNEMKDKPKKLKVEPKILFREVEEQSSVFLRYKVARVKRNFLRKKI